MPGQSRHAAAARRLLATVLVAVALGWPLVASGEVQPGDVITKANQDKIKGLVSEGVQWCVNRGMEMKVIHYAFTTVDMQLEHGTRVAIPGVGFQDEPGWYLDVGEKYGGEESWFSIAALISAGR